MNLNILNKIFPYNKNLNKLKYDNEGVWSITTPIDANKISNIIKKELNNTNIILFDGTAGIGGNTISFCNNFKHTIAIEIDTNRFNILKNNINIYNIKNITLINDNCINHLNNNYDCFFFDPPWGGPDYKYYKKLSLKIDNYTISELIILIKKKFNKSIFFKLPNNYDLNEIYTFNYKIYKINNYLFLIIK
jgi:16S rRNA G966 N2-methylase RsmD